MWRKYYSIMTLASIKACTPVLIFVSIACRPEIFFNLFIYQPFTSYIFQGEHKHELHFMSFLPNDLVQVVEILPPVRQGPTYST